MSFSYGASTGGGFSFGGASSNPTPAPSTGGFSFGTGAAGAPATASTGGGFSFSAPGTTAPSPAPSSSFPFGGPAPAPSTAFSFSSQSPAPTGAFGLPFQSFGQQQQQQQPFQQQQQQQQQPQFPPPPQISISGNMLYSSLPDKYKQAINNLHNAIQQHKRTMCNVQSMAPQFLVTSSSSGDGGGGTNAPSSSNALPHRMSKLQNEITRLQQDLQSTQVQATHAIEKSEQLVTQLTLFGQWPIEAVAVRRGVPLRRSTSSGAAGKTPGDTSASSSSTAAGSLSFGANVTEEKKSDDNSDQERLQARIRALLDGQLAYVDRIERMPSPYFVQVLDEIQQRLKDLDEQAKCVQRQLREQEMQGLDNAATDAAGSSRNTLATLESLVQTQHEVLWQLAGRISDLNTEMKTIRALYSSIETDDKYNVLIQADREERDRERRLDEALLMQYVQAGNNNSNSISGGNQPGQAPGTTAAPGLGGGALTPGGFVAPASAPGAFGSSAPAPSTSAFSFGGTGGTNPAPASSAFSFPTTAALGTTNNPQQQASAPAPGATGLVWSNYATSGTSSRKKGGSSKSTGRLNKK